MSAKKAKKSSKKKGKFFSTFMVGILICAAGFLLAYALNHTSYFAVEYNVLASTTSAVLAPSLPPPPMLDKALYDQKMLYIANNPLPKPIATSTASSTLIKKTASTSLIKANLASTTPPLWPVKAPYPNYGAILPFSRIVAYYGNFYSKNLGVLGEYPPAQMLQMLMGEVAKWQAADPNTPVIPAIDYIAVTAQGSPGADGMYRLRMPADQIQKAIDLANQVNGIVFLDVQVGLSNLQTEIPLLAPYLKLPNVELAVDPEFSMKTGAKPGTIIGTLNSTDINFTANYLAQIVQQNNIPPKILVVHRFTEHMVTGVSNITPLPEVQIVMDMDGWGSPPQKLKTYLDYVYDEPVQFAGFKLFYKNDLLPPSTRMLTPAELVKIRPAPIYIQYQ